VRSRTQLSVIVDTPVRLPAVVVYGKLPYLGTSASAPRSDSAGTPHALVEFGTCDVAVDG
jgi:hypothetical protein